SSCVARAVLAAWAVAVIVGPSEVQAARTTRRTATAECRARTERYHGRDARTGHTAGPDRYGERRPPRPDHRGARGPRRRLPARACRGRGLRRLLLRPRVRPAERRRSGHRGRRLPRAGRSPQRADPRRIDPRLQRLPRRRRPQGLQPASHPRVRLRQVLLDLIQPASRAPSMPLDRWYLQKNTSTPLAVSDTVTRTLW